MTPKPLISIASFLVLVLFVLSSCGNKKNVNFSHEKEKILELHNAQRDYHFNKDSIAFANQLSENFISVNRGKISSPKKEETISRYHGYFSSVEFLKWTMYQIPLLNFQMTAPWHILL